MLDLGWSELLIIGVVALIVVGPKDLPKMLRTLGQYAGRAKGIAREFQRSMDDAARQADIEELHEVKKGLDDMRDAQHKMQRDLGQSFLDSPKKPEAKKPDSKKPAAKKPDSRKSAVKKAGGGTVAAPAKAKTTAADAMPVEVATPKPAKAATRKPARNASTSKAEPGSVSGA
jgi:sec-independent protein translocase protein TatB